MQTSKNVTKPSKQRKMLFQAPNHIRHRLFSSRLSDNLRASHRVKSLPVRSGDTVQIMRGDHKGLEGKVTRIDRKKYRIYLEGLTREKVDGSTIFVSVHPSKVTITNLTLDDKWRKKILEKKKTALKRTEELEKKPLKEPVEIKEEVSAEIIKEKAVPKKKLKEQRPRKRKVKITKEAVAEKTEKEKVEAEPEEKPKAKKPRAKRKTKRKSEGEP